MVLEGTRRPFQELSNLEIEGVDSSYACLISSGHEMEKLAFSPSASACNRNFDQDMPPLANVRSSTSLSLAGSEDQDCTWNALQRAMVRIRGLGRGKRRLEEQVAELKVH
jgi:hypothetical protein